ncbi:MAG: hypothetical protein ACI8RD_001562 [Bacillariaceae sp.]|jgi:hypothetical protein
MTANKLISTTSTGTATLLILALLSSICSNVVVDASYAISIAPDSEECFTYMTPKDVGITSIIT